ncbi:hypothetical protein [Chryseobacterium sp. YIM B08800]|uniref:hypothetical protein n=1 Tax=Chryseobacterium sp. YIM B08800 TaxID=2984136 RepID=UPI00223FB212|nr:hypothetical protein [Chryseobacterium sp. YIM B08800]
MKNITLDFIKGVLYTYADLNTPNSNLSYEYEILEMELEEDESIFYRNKFQLPEECLFTIEDINFEEFQKSLNNWFFKNGEILNLRINDTRESYAINMFFSELNDVVCIKNIKKVEFDYSAETYYELGINYEYFFIEGVKNKYLIYFKYED